VVAFKTLPALNTSADLIVFLPNEISRANLFVNPLFGGLEFFKRDCASGLAIDGTVDEVEAVCCG